MVSRVHFARKHHDFIIWMFQYYFQKYLKTTFDFTVFTIPVEMNAYVCPHVLGADGEDLVLLHPLGVGPLGDDVVGDPLHQVLRHLVQRHELPEHRRMGNNKMYIMSKVLVYLTTQVKLYLILNRHHLPDLQLSDYPALKLP